MLSEEVVNWLMEPANPSIRYRSMVELLDKSSNDGEVQQCKDQIALSHPVTTLLDKMHPAGYWLQTNPRTREVLGDGVKYGAFATTHYCLAYLPSWVWIAPILP